MYTRRFWSAPVLSAFTFAASYSALNGGGGVSQDWSRALLALGLGGAACALLPTRRDTPSPVQRAVLWTAILLPAFVWFQLVPLPLSIVQTISAARADLASSVRLLLPHAQLAPIAINAARTWEHFFRVLGYAVAFLSAWKISRSSGQHSWLPATPVILIGAAEAVWGLAHSSVAQPVTGTFSNHAQFSGFLEMILPLAVLYPIALLCREPRSGVGPALIASACALLGLAIAIFTAIFLAVSKMGFITTLGSLLAMGTLFLSTRVPGWKKWPALLGLVVISATMFLTLAPNELITAFDTVSSDPSGEGRMPIWADTLKLIAAYPLFGCGLGNYFPGLLKYQTAGLHFAWVNAHNDYLELLAELGAIGFVIAAALIILVLVCATRATVSAPSTEKRLLGLACVGGIAAALIHSLADFNLYVPADAMVLAWISGLAVGTFHHARPPSRQAGTKSARTLGPRRTALLVVSSLAGVYSAAWLVFLLLGFNVEAKAEPVFCRFGICDTYGLEGALELQHGVNTTGKLPPSEVEELLRRDPAGPYRWEDLGDSFQSAGRTGYARYCYTKAVELGPNIPYMLYRAANFYFGLRENRQAMALMSRAMLADQEYQGTGFIAYANRRIGLDEILRYGLPDRRSYQEYLRFLVGEAKTADAETTWNWILSHRYADDKLANEYVEYLVGKKQYEAAQEAWAHYACRRDKSYPEANRIFNGDFEADPAGSRFDWRIEPAQGVEIGFDQAVRHSGARSLRIRFDGTQNVSSVGVGQNVFLKPGRYRFEAYMRTSDVSTDEGVAFNVVDPDSPNRLNFTTENKVGTNDWKLVEHAFRVLPGTGLIQVSLVRKPSLRFDNQIRGIVWIDQVSITPQ